MTLNLQDNKRPYFKQLNLDDTFDEIENAINAITDSKKVYKALLTQTGTSSPTAIVLENTLGDIVWSYVGVGEYKAVLTDTFTDNKTFQTISSISGNLFSFYKISESEIDVYTTDLTGTELNGLLVDTPILIEVYP